MIGRARQRTRILVGVFLVAAIAAGTSPAQTPPHGAGETLELRGEIAFWNLGRATVRNEVWNAVVDPGGGFDLLLTAPPRSELIPVREYDGVDCLDASNAESRYLPLFFFEVAPPGGPALPLHLRSARFDEGVGQAVAEFHYYSEATTVSGRCAIEYDDGKVAVYEFPSLELRAGWNALTATVTGIDHPSVTYRVGLAEAGPALRWEVGDPGTEPEEPYVGIGVTIGHHPSGLEVKAVLPGSPAEAAGLREGDVVTRIGDVPTATMNVGAAILRVTGSEGEAVLLDVLRGDERLEFEVPRAIVGGTSP